MQTQTQTTLEGTETRRGLFQHGQHLIWLNHLPHTINTETECIMFAQTRVETSYNRVEVIKEDIQP